MPSLQQLQLTSTPLGATLFAPLFISSLRGANTEFRQLQLGGVSTELRQLRELGLSRLEKRRLPGDLNEAFQELSGKMGQDCLQEPAVTGQEGICSN